MDLKVAVPVSTTPSALSTAAVTTSMLGEESDPTFPGSLKSYCTVESYTPYARLTGLRRIHSDQIVIPTAHPSHSVSPRKQARAGAAVPFSRPSAFTTFERKQNLKFENSSSPAHSAPLCVGSDTCIPYTVPSYPVSTAVPPQMPTPHQIRSSSQTYSLLPGLPTYMIAGIPESAPVSIAPIPPFPFLFSPAPPSSSGGGGVGCTLFPMASLPSAGTLSSHSSSSNLEESCPAPIVAFPFQLKSPTRSSSTMNSGFNTQPSTSPLSASLSPILYQVPQASLSSSSLSLSLPSPSSSSSSITGSSNSISSTFSASLSQPLDVCSAQPRQATVPSPFRETASTTLPVRRMSDFMLLKSLMCDDTAIMQPPSSPAISHVLDSSDTWLKKLNENFLHGAFSRHGSFLSEPLQVDSKDLKCSSSVLP